jgi:hypoxanthine phosphoribosyltransferase
MENNITVEKLYFTNIQMRNALIQIEDKLVHDMWLPDIILGVNRGGCIPGVYLSHRLKKEHAVIDVRLRDHAARPNLSVLEKEFAGATFQYIIDNFGRHDRIRYAAVINNRPSPVKIDYYGYEIDKNENPQWVVFPWEEWQK